MFFINELSKPENKRVFNYLLERGLTGDDIHQFEIGYTSKRGDLVLHLSSLGYNDRQILDAGLSAKNESGEYYERFINRIITHANFRRGPASYVALSDFHRRDLSRFFRRRRAPCAGCRRDFGEI